MVLNSGSRSGALRDCDCAQKEAPPKNVNKTMPAARRRRVSCKNFVSCKPAPRDTEYIRILRTQQQERQDRDNSTAWHSAGRSRSLQRWEAESRSAKGLAESAGCSFPRPGAGLLVFPA